MVSMLYECLLRSAMDKFVQLCVMRHTSKPQSTRAPMSCGCEHSVMTTSFDEGDLEMYSVKVALSMEGWGMTECTPSSQSRLASQPTE